MPGIKDIREHPHYIINVEIIHFMLATSINSLLSNQTPMNIDENKKAVEHNPSKLMNGNYNHIIIVTLEFDWEWTIYIWLWLICDGLL